MSKKQIRAPFELSGRWGYRLRSIFNLYWAVIYVSCRRLFRGPLLPNWGWGLETSNYFVKLQSSIAFDMPNSKDSREYEDALVFSSRAVAKMNIESVSKPVKGHWYQPKSGTCCRTVLYLHGGGYAYYSKIHANLISQVTLAAESRTFALDYRLIPEHPFPAQLEDALAAYCWLLETQVSPDRLVIIGDSAGGNLVLSLLLKLRQAQLPFPALAICLAPWTDITNSGESMSLNEAYDWVEKRMPVRWADWYCASSDATSPQISPIYADLRGLPPIYIQAGSAEILYDMICSFAEQGRKQGADVSLEVWPNMPHDFQAFGDMLPESRHALQRIGEVVMRYVT